MVRHIHCAIYSLDERPTFHYCLPHWTDYFLVCYSSYLKHFIKSKLHAAK